MRENFVIPLHPAVDAHSTAWAAGYATEPSWLDHDLQAAGLPALSTLWRD